MEAGSPSSSRRDPGNLSLPLLRAKVAVVALCIVDTDRQAD